MQPIASGAWTEAARDATSARRAAATAPPVNAMTGGLKYAYMTGRSMSAVVMVRMNGYATRITAKIVTTRPVPVTTSVSRKIAKNATVMATAYQNATLIYAKAVLTANAKFAMITPI
jgi:hypothetical protein